MTRERESPLSNEALLAVLNERLDGSNRLTNERLDQLRIDYSNLLALVREGFAENVRAHQRAEDARQDDRKAMGILSTIQDGIVDWKTKHDAWHGPEDISIKKRIAHDDDVRRSVWKAQYAFFFGGAGVASAVVLVLALIHGYL